MIVDLLKCSNEQIEKVSNSKRPSSGHKEQNREYIQTILVFY